METIADLHIHSRFSRATSRDCDLPRLHAAAQRKGIAIVGTGDFTHPGWLEELETQLRPAEEGLYRLRDDLAAAADEDVPRACRRPVRFLPTAEISNIYKKDGRTRKNHNLLLAPSLEAARAIHAALARVGNVRSDGRPILGLDARDLLEIVLEADANAVLVPAHVWTPWFSLFGSKSGFDALEECFGDLSDHVFALETGLSSDPPMNWRLSALDRYTLVSHSDAHSPEKLGREADLLDIEPSYPALRRALETGEGFLGTLEFFPEEGKYHLDGHRACAVSLTPDQTRACGGLCPRCGKPVTVGVLNRVAALADRAEGLRPDGAPGFESLVPLKEILGECLGTGPGSKKVARAALALAETLGPELDVLRRATLDAVETVAGPLVAEAVRRVREGRVRPQGGYDGEFGVIRVFDAGERDALRGQGALFVVPRPEPPVAAEPPSPPEPPAAGPLFTGTPEQIAPHGGPEEGLNPEQRAAVDHGRGPLLVAAGPGTGKTRVVAHRIARLVSDGLAAPREILALTFTNQAARELAARLRRLLGGADAQGPTACTFHSLCARLLREEDSAGFAVLSESEAAARMARAAATSGAKKRRAGALAARVSQAKREGFGAFEAERDERFGPEVAAVFRAYRAILDAEGALDFDDLILRCLDLLRGDPSFLERTRARFPWVFVDEFQDVNAAQAALVRLLAPPGANLTVVGDPDQAIYGFRGASPAHFRRFGQDYPDAAAVRLRRNYRSPDTILAAAAQVMERSADGFGGAVVSGISGERVVVAELASVKAEAEYVTHSIEKALGGVSFFSRDSGRVGDGPDRIARSFADFAVLYRTEAQGEEVVSALSRLGIPCQRVGTNRLLDKPAFRTVYEALRALGPAPYATVAQELEALARSLSGDEADAARRLLPLADSFGHDLAAFLDHLALGSELDAFAPRADRVSCMTLHASKGLEFPVVFILACEDGLLPFRIAGRCDDLEEERRLFFVGVTRARQVLHLCRARKRRRYGKTVENPPSPFLLEIGSDLMQPGALPAGRRKPRDGPHQLDLFGAP